MKRVCADISDANHKLLAKLAKERQATMEQMLQDAVWAYLFALRANPGKRPVPIENPLTRMRRAAK